MAITISEFEYQATQTARMHQNRSTSAILVAVITGLLIIAVAAVEFYGISWVRARIIRVNSWTGIAAALAPPAERDQFFRNMGITEVVLVTWSCGAWAAASLLALAGLWTLVRRQLGWRMLWVGAIATILAAVLTVVGGHVLENYAHFEERDWRFYATAFLMHSLPGWVILATWLIGRLRRQRRVEPAVETGTAGDANAATDE